MLYPDTDTRRVLAREHQADLRREWGSTSPDRPEVVQTRRRLRLLRLSRLRIQRRAAGGLT
jgi:hypothetical protein